MARSKVMFVGTLALACWMAGGGIAMAALSEDEWQTEATAICIEADTAIDEAATSVFGGLGPDEQPTDEQLGEFADQIIPVIDSTVQDVVDLDEPASYKKNVKKWAKAARAVLAKAEDDPSIFNTPNPFVKANKIAKKLGLEGCD